MRRIRAVALVKDSPPNEGNSENLEVSVGSDAEIRIANAFFLLEHRAKTIRGLGHLLLRDEQKHSVGKATIHGQAARRADVVHAR